MSLPIHWRVALASAAVSALLLLGVGLYLQAGIRSQVTQDARQALLAQTRLVQRALPPPWRTGAELQAKLDELDKLSGARVTLIGPDGIVLGDSEHDASTMENHSGRPERLQALQQGWGSAVRHSATLNQDMLYLALAADPPAPHGTIIRLAVPLTAVERASARLRQALAVALIVVALLLLLSGAWLARALTLPVRNLVAVARRVGRGDMQARVPDGRSGELAELGHVLNSALDQLSELLGSSQRRMSYYAAILEQMTDAVVVTDAGGLVQFVNPAFGRAFGVSPDQTEPQLLGRLALNYDLSVLLARAVSQNSTQQDEIRLQRPEERTLAAVATPLVSEDGRVVGAVGLLHDVTELYRMDQVRRDFVSNASHELRTPTAGIRALAEALQGGALGDPEKGPHFVTRIVEAADRLTQILDDMLTLTRVERGPELMQPKWVAALPALEEAAAHMQPAADLKGITLPVGASQEDQVWADPLTLQTVLINLLDNAVKYTLPEGRVVVGGRMVSGGYEFSVADTGIGIPPEDLPRIFERFYRVEKGRSVAQGGTGLGLAIVKHIVEAHKGRVTVRSTPGAGSTFTVFLPSPNGNAQSR